MPEIRNRLTGVVAEVDESVVPKLEGEWDVVGSESEPVKRRRPAAPKAV